MRLAEHMPSRMGTLEDRMKKSTGIVRTNIPMCPPPCDCADCQTCYYTLTEQQFEPYHYTAVLTDADARSTLAKYTQAIVSCRDYLHEAIQKHGDHIYDRWRKRNQQKRTDVLQAAEPELPKLKGHMAEEEYFGKGLAHSRKQPAFRKYLLLPYLDIQTLVKNPATLIGLINTRAQHLPEEWAPYDHEQLRNTWGLGLLEVSFNAGAVVIFGPKYGTYTQWTEDAAHRFDVVGFPRGKLLLEAQMTLMTFLRRVVERLIVGVQDEATFIGASKWISATGAGLKMNGDAAAWSNFVHTPFLAPPRFNVSALVDLTKARVAGTGDHLWLLQTEAAYLKRYMRKLSQMYSVENARQKELALTIINCEIMGDIDRHWFWRGALLEFENLQVIYHRYRDSVAPGQPLPKKVDDTLGALELVLVNAIHDRSKELHAMIVQRPGFRDNYVCIDDMPKIASNTHETAFMIEKFGQTEDEGNANVYRMERLWWILTQLQGEPDSQTRFRYPMLLDMLDQHLATCDPAEAARLDEILYDRLSDYTTLLELLWSVRLHCPRPNQKPAASHSLNFPGRQQNHHVSAAAGKTIPLSKTAFKTLRSMFPATTEERQKSITWSILVASMDEAGFAARNGGGAGSIVFHRPHPGTVVDPVMLQAMGWRMNKWFGWEREVFVLARK